MVLVLSVMLLATYGGKYECDSGCVYGGQADQSLFPGDDDPMLTPCGGLTPCSCPQGQVNRCDFEHLAHPDPVIAGAVLLVVSVCSFCGSFYFACGRHGAPSKPPGPKGLPDSAVAAPPGAHGTEPQPPRPERPDAGAAAHPDQLDYSPPEVEPESIHGIVLVNSPPEGIPKTSNYPPEGIPETVKK